MEEKITQKQALLRYMQEHGSITSYEAIYELGITRLSGQIFSLKKDGYDIISRPIKVPTRYGKKTIIAEYTLIS